MKKIFLIALIALLCFGFTSMVSAPIIRGNVFDFSKDSFVYKKDGGIFIDLIDRNMGVKVLVQDIKFKWGYDIENISIPYKQAYMPFWFEHQFPIIFDPCKLDLNFVTSYPTSTQILWDYNIATPNYDAKIITTKCIAPYVECDNFCDVENNCVQTCQNSSSYCYISGERKYCSHGIDVNVCSWLEYVPNGSYTYKIETKWADLKSLASCPLKANKKYWFRHEAIIPAGTTIVFDVNAVFNLPSIGQFVFSIPKPSWTSTAPSDFNVGVGYDLNYTKVKPDGNVMPVAYDYIFNDSNQVFYDNNLLAQYRFHDKNSTGNGIIDDSNNANNALLLQGADINAIGLWDTNALFGNGWKGYAEAPAQKFDTNQELTITAWIKENKTQIMQVSGGVYHTCALLYNGRALCWGRNVAGGLGNGTTTDSLTPVAVIGEYTFKKISVGMYHTCGLDYNGSVYCWGYNLGRQLGDGTTINRYTPVKVLTATNTMKDIGTGTDHSCALDTNQTAVLCWGENQYGTLGNNSTTDSATPVHVIGSYNFVQIAIGYNHDCAIDANGMAQCWGYAGDGRLGDGQTTTNRTTPVTVIGTYNFDSISAGSNHTCATDANGMAQCWGDGAQGELGDGGGTDRTTPVTVKGAYTAASIAAGYTASYMIDQNGTPLSWGYNAYGELNDGTLTNRTSPISMQRTDYNFLSISAGSNYACGLDQNSTPFCWGYNNFGVLGNGTKSFEVLPKQVVGGQEFGKIGVGRSHSCGIDPSGTIAKCWGWNYNAGNLGIGTMNIANYPTPQTVLGKYTFIDIAPAYASSVSMHTCAVDANGEAYCWGEGTLGQLGTNGTADKSSPAKVVGTYNFFKIIAQRYGGCGLDKNGMAQCWGRNLNGEVGDGTTTQRNSPVTVLGAYNYSQITAGYDHTCATDANGEAYCWGLNSSGQLGDGTVTTPRTSPVKVIGTYNYIQIAGGNAHSCAVDANGEAYCWGEGGSGQLGRNSTTDSYSPAKVLLGSNTIKNIAAGTSFSCALDRNGTVLCWGAGGYGQLGDGTTIVSRNAPVHVKGDYNFLSISASSSHVCGMLVDNNTALCWGFNETGSLGNGVANIFAPTPVIKNIIVGKSTETFAIANTFDNNIAVFINEVGVYKTGNVALDEGWHHIALTFDHNTFTKLYIDGTEEARFAQRTNIYQQTKNLLIGQDMNGALDDVKIYSRALSAEEIAQDYNAWMKGKYYSPIKDAGATVQWQTMQWDDWVDANNSITADYRSCDDPNCNTETWTTGLENCETSACTLTIGNNQYFQYRINFDTNAAQWNKHTGTEFARISNVNIEYVATGLNCGDTITTNTTMTADLTECADNGLEIGASSITLNCDGHKIYSSGTNITGYAVLVLNQTSVTIKNCDINGFYQGIYYWTSSTDGTIMDNNISSVGCTGIMLNGSCHRATIKNNRIYDAKWNGLTIGETNDANVYNNYIMNSGLNGIYLTSAPRNNKFFYNIIDNNMQKDTNGIYSFNDEFYYGGANYFYDTNVGGSQRDIAIFSPGTTRDANLYFIDANYDTLFIAGATATVFLGHWQDTVIKDDANYSNIGNANTIITDQYNKEYYSGLTIANGTIPRQALYNQRITTSDANIYYFAPYDTNVTVDGYDANGLTYLIDVNQELTIYMHLTGAPPTDTCSCPASGNWEIINGDVCTLDDECNLTGGGLHIVNGTLNITSIGTLVIPSGQKLVIEKNVASFHVEKGGKFTIIK